jgi:spore coat polysaccharide biosynthesis protein SpsF
MSDNSPRMNNQHPVNQLQSKYVMAFLQARMGSTRLPGKVLMRIHGQSILERAIRRLRASPSIDEVAVLTTRLREDDGIETEARRFNARIYRGPEQDVLARFYEAAEKFQPDIIIRTTADNPLIEIGSIDRIVEALRSKGLDWCMEQDLPYGAATEALTAEALRRVHHKAEESHHREHVTLYIKEHTEEFRRLLLSPPEFLRYPQIRITVDTPEDFLFMDQLIGLLPHGVQQLPLGEYLPLALTILHERECKALAIS